MTKPVSWESLQWYSKIQLYYQLTSGEWCFLPVGGGSRMDTWRSFEVLFNSDFWEVFNHKISIFFIYLPWEGIYLIKYDNWWRPWCSNTMWIGPLLTQLWISHIKPIFTSAPSGSFIYQISEVWDLIIHEKMHKSMQQINFKCDAKLADRDRWTIGRGFNKAGCCISNNMSSRNTYGIASRRRITRTRNI